MYLKTACCLDQFVSKCRTSIWKPRRLRHSECQVQEAGWSPKHVKRLVCYKDRVWWIWRFPKWMEYVRISRGQNVKLNADRMKWNWSHSIISEPFPLFEEIRTERWPGALEDRSVTLLYLVLCSSLLFLKS